MTASEARSSPKPASSRKFVVYAALAGNAAVALTKLMAAFVTGSAGMFSEAVHSVVDTANEILLLHGYRRAERKPSFMHPLGYGRELYFWSFIVSLLLFGLGAGVSVYQGIRHVMEPHPIEHIAVSYAVLGLSLVFEGTSWTIAWRTFARIRGDTGFWVAFRRSKDPPSFMVLFEDSAALIGISFAVAGLAASQITADSVYDGIASILIGLVLAVTATLLAVESKSLLIGERAPPALVADICRLTQEQPGVANANSALTAQLAPDQVLVALSIEFNDDLCTSQIEACVAAIEDKVRTAHPEVVSLFVKPQTLKQFEAAARKRFGNYPFPRRPAQADRELAAE